MRLKIEIDSDTTVGSACATRYDVCKILEDLLPKIRLAGTESEHAILDFNGNQVGYYSISADDELEDENDEEDSSPAVYLTSLEKKELFFKQCKQAGYDVREYRGRNFYIGPGVDVSSYDDVHRIAKISTVDIQTDNMGKGYIVYPKI